MAEYIDRDDAVKAILKWEDKPCFSFLAVARDVMNVSVADVVEVVRCKDCKMANSCSDDREMYCTLNHCYKDKNYFCADGKKKEES